MMAHSAAKSGSWHPPHVGLRSRMPGHRDPFQSLADLPWQTVPRLRAPDVVQQLEPDWCGPACAQMLLADRERHILQTDVADRLAVPTTATRLARCMSEISDILWAGGQLATPAPPSWDTINSLSSEKGSWAALLEPHGFTHVGHWVVVDGIEHDGVVLVRDPVGAAYGILLADFLALWQFTFLVMERNR